MHQSCRTTYLRSGMRLLTLIKFLNVFALCDTYRELHISEAGTSQVILFCTMGSRSCSFSAGVRDGWLSSGRTFALPAFRPRPSTGEGQNATIAPWVPWSGCIPIGMVIKCHQSKFIMIYTPIEIGFPGKPYHNHTITHGFVRASCFGRKMTTLAPWCWRAAAFVHRASKESCDWPVLVKVAWLGQHISVESRWWRRWVRMERMLHGVSMSHFHRKWFEEALARTINTQSQNIKHNQRYLPRR